MKIGLGLGISYYNLRKLSKKGSFPQWFKDSLVCWYDPHKQGLKNSQIVKGQPFLLKDFSNNHLDMTMHGFDGEGMSGMGGYGEDFSKPTSYPSNNAATVYYSDKKNVHFKGKGENSGIWYKPIIKTAYKVNIKGLKIGQTLFYKCFIAGSVKILKKINENGIHILPEIPQEAALIYFLGDCDVTIEQLPLYEGALCFDGVDDYGISEEQPILNDYTVIAKRIRIKNNAYLCSKTDGDNKRGAFIFEGQNTWSFGKLGSLTPTTDDDITYQSKGIFNGISIEFGNVEDTDILLLGTWGRKNLKLRMAFYSLLLFNRTLAQEELDYVKYVIMGAELPKPIARWSAKGKTNEDTDN